MPADPKKDSSRSFLTGIAVQIALSLPAGIAQACGLIEGISGSPFPVRLLVPFLGVPFNTGGLSTRLLFEHLVGPLEFLAGHRSATVLSNLPFYLVLLTIQTLLVALLFALRSRHRHPSKDPLTLGLLVLFLANSLANASWPWWGT